MSLNDSPTFASSSAPATSTRLVRSPAAMRSAAWAARFSGVVTMRATTIAMPTMRASSTAPPPRITRCTKARVSCSSCIE